MPSFTCRCRGALHPRSSERSPFSVETSGHCVIPGHSASNTSGVPGLVRPAQAGVRSGIQPPRCLGTRFETSSAAQAWQAHAGDQAHGAAWVAESNSISFPVGGTAVGWGNLTACDGMFESAGCCALTSRWRLTPAGTGRIRGSIDAHLGQAEDHRVAISAPLVPLSPVSAPGYRQSSVGIRR